MAPQEREKRVHFQRFAAPDEQVLGRQVVDAERALATARASGDEMLELRSAIELGNLLTTARREREAVDILIGVKSLAQSAGPEALGWWLLHLGTANQYLDDRFCALERFEQALEVARAHALASLESYVCHHMGRLQVEGGEFEAARMSFTRAVALRESLGDSREASSRRALDALNSIGSLPGTARSLPR